MWPTSWNRKIPIALPRAQGDDMYTRISSGICENRTFILKITWGGYERNPCIRGTREFIISLKIRCDYWLCFRCYDTHVYRHVRTRGGIVRRRRLHSVPEVLMLTAQQIDIYFISSQFNDYNSFLSPSHLL